MPNPEFEGQTKTRLGNPEVRKVVEGVVAAGAQAAHCFMLVLCSKSSLKPASSCSMPCAAWNLRARQPAPLASLRRLKCVGLQPLQMAPHTVFVIPLSSRVLAYCCVPAEAGEALEMEPTTLNTILAKAMQVGGMARPSMRVIAHRGVCPRVALACSTARVQQRMSCRCITCCQPLP